MFLLTLEEVVSRWVISATHTINLLARVYPSFRVDIFKRHYLRLLNNDIETCDLVSTRQCQCLLEYVGVNTTQWSVVHFGDRHNKIYQAVMVLLEVAVRADMF